MSTLQQSAQPSHLESLVDQIAANQNLQNLLADLPDRTRRSVMVPFGNVAFFPGQLVHTNECLVNMGEVTYVLNSLGYRHPVFGLGFSVIAENHIDFGRCWYHCREVCKGDCKLIEAATASAWYTAGLRYAMLVTASNSNLAPCSM